MGTDLGCVTDPAHPHRCPGRIRSRLHHRHLLPHNRHLAITTAYGPIKFWDTNLPHAVARACDTTSAGWTEDLWRHHLPQLPYRPPC
ncbi:hypothetical protein ACFYTS_24235 [Nocardia sp. NPDC004151]|uniref:hypothetical protein n=1 Tax=Nocardia sp. NPDC004151 TaxID=3364304 RepID=UPI0036A67ECF